MALILLVLCVAAVCFYLVVFVHFVYDEKRNRMNSGARLTVIRPEGTGPKSHLDEIDRLKEEEGFHAKIRIVP
jgi:hypothetical protein